MDSESNFTLSESPLSPTFGDSLYRCSSYGFSSLQSPSAFPSFSSDDSSEQIEPSRPDHADRCPSLLHCCAVEASLDAEESGSSRSDYVDQQPSLHLLCGVEGSSDIKEDAFTSQRLLSQTCVDSQENFLQDESIFEENVLSSMHRCHTEIFPFLSKQVSLSPSAGLDVSWSDEAQHALTSGTCDNNVIHLEKGSAQITEDSEPRAHERHAQVSETTRGRGRNICGVNINAPIVDPSVVTCSKQSVSITVSLNSKDGGCKDYLNEMCLKESKGQSLQAIDGATSPSSLSRCELKQRKIQEPLKERNQHKRVAYSVHSSCAKSPLKDLKENLNPQTFKQEPMKSNNLKVDPGGWMCPRDAKKAFKPKSYQMPLDKWLTRQR